MTKTVSYAQWSLEPYCIGMKLRSLRTQKRLTLSRLAAETRLSTALLSKLETDRMIPTLPTLATISRVYGVGMSYFFSEPAGTRSPSRARPTCRGNGRGAGAGEDHAAERAGRRAPAGGADDRVSARRGLVRDGCAARDQRRWFMCWKEAAVGRGRNARGAGGGRLRLHGERDGAGLERGGQAPLPGAGGAARRRGAAVKANLTEPAS